MEFEITWKDISDVAADAAIGILAAPGGDEPLVSPAWRDRTGGLAAELAESGELSAKHQSTALLHRPQSMAAAKLVLATCDFGAEGGHGRIAEAAGAAWRRLRTTKVESVAVHAPTNRSAEESVGEVIEGIAAADYEPDQYKTENRSESKLKRVIVCVAGREQSSESITAVEDARRISAAIAHGRRVARELANEPGNLLPPRVLAERATVAAARAGLECEVLDKAQLEEMGAGALLGVARGSSEPPVMIVIRYRPDGGQAASNAALGNSEPVHLGLVGKAVSFDTGGISIKPSADMHLMKYDMAGGAAMIGAMVALADLKPSIPVTAVVPSVENMPGGSAQRPGDVVTSLSGTTVEVLNTDAEGRLILADAISYAKGLGCNRLVDAATLTGAIVVALGHSYTGVFANDSGWMERILESAARAGERMWAMPPTTEYKQQLKSPIADLANIGTRWGGACSAAAFLTHFADGTPFVHLDIAGTAWLERKLPHAPVGPSGVGVATLVRLALGEAGN